MSLPLRLRLRPIAPADLVLGEKVLVAAERVSVDDVRAIRNFPVKLEFQNPINDSWHPVEMVIE